MVSGSYSEDIFLRLDFSILGIIIEKVTGNSYEHELRQRILNPLNLQNTYLYPFDDIDKNIAPVYNPETGEFIDTTANYMNKAMMSMLKTGDAIVSTSKDITHFMYSLFNDTILLSDSLFKIMTPSKKIGEYGINPLGFYHSVHPYEDDSVNFITYDNLYHYSRIYAINLLEFL